MDIGVNKTKIEKRMQQKMRFFEGAGDSIKNHGVFDTHNFLWKFGGIKLFGYRI